MAARGWRLRLIGLPLWVIAMIGYKARLYGRKTLKEFGLRLLVGDEVLNTHLQPRIDAFVAQQLTRNIQPGAIAQITADRTDGVRLILITAAPEIYVDAMAQALGFDACIATLHRRDENGNLRAAIEGHNNYGPVKIDRVKAWLTAHGIDRADCHITAYTDHASDAPILNFADVGVLVGRYAKRQGEWLYVDWSGA